MSTQQPAEVSFRREKALLIACLPALTGGDLNACPRIAHRVFANAQTANLAFRWVYATSRSTAA